MRVAVLLLTAAVELASAHFKLEYPEWRSDSLAENTTFSQWDYPCAGVPYGAGNKTEWSLTGGAVVLDLHHPWAYVYINLGLGENSTNFNISLTPNLLNVTGKGTFCLPNLSLPSADTGATITDGLSGTIQVVTNGQSGSALYNCADITFKSSPQPLADGVCTNSTGVTAAIVGQDTTTTPSSTSSSTPGSTSSSTPTPTPNGAAVGVFGAGSQAAILGVTIASILVALV